MNIYTCINIKTRRGLATKNNSCFTAWSLVSRTSGSFARITAKVFSTG